MDYPDLYPPQSVFDYLRTKKPLTYKLVPLDLSVVRDSIPESFQGNFIQILSITKGASIQIAFNEFDRDKITFTDVQHKFGLYQKVFYTNTAQAGASCLIFFGLNEFYIPFFKSDITSDLIIKPKIDLVKQYALTVGNTPTLLTMPATSRPVKVVMYNNTGKTIYLGDSSVSVADGYPLFDGQNLPLDFHPHYLSAGIYARVSSGSYTLNYLVFATEI